MAKNQELPDFEALEIRPAQNGFVILLRTEEDETEHVFDSQAKVMRFIKKLITVEND